MATDTKQQLDELPESLKRQELQRLLAEIEKRMLRSGKIYLAFTSKVTSEMIQYFKGLNEKIEDCGTRHFPKNESFNQAV